MLSYTTWDRKRKVTLQHFDLFWWGTERAEWGDVFVLERKNKNDSCPPSILFFSALALALTVFCSRSRSLPVGLIGRWKRLRCNNKPLEEATGETERWQKRRRRVKGESAVHSRASTCVDRARRSAPVLISITLTAPTYIEPPGK